MSESVVERRGAERSRRLLVCWFDAGYRDVEGLIENLSDAGLFVRTR